MLGPQPLSFFNTIKQDLFYRSHNMKSYEPKIFFEIESGRYLLKTATTEHELKSAFRLRYQIFFNKKNALLDIDQFDSACDHLVIIDQSSKNVVGTYRLNTATHLQNFYSQSQFDLKSFMFPYTNFVELGRACIAPDHRQGAVISLLWKGIYYYMRQMKADLLFGCSSLKNISHTEAVLVYKYFEQTGILNPKYQINPHLSFQLPFFVEHLHDLDEKLSDFQLKQAENLIPPLLKTYIKVGAEVISRPAYDAEMNCIDFLTSLKTTNLAKRFERRLEKLAG